MSLRIQVFISMSLFLFSAICFFIGYKHIERELSKLDDMLLISLRENSFLEGRSNILFIIHSTTKTSPAIVRRSFLEFNHSYNIYVNALRNSTLPKDTIATEISWAKSAYDAISQNYTTQPYHPRFIDTLRQSSMEYRKKCQLKILILISPFLLLAILNMVYGICITQNYTFMKQKFYIDPLTQVHNRNYIKNILKSDDISHIVMIDIDDFKIINDQYGHLVGDLVLVLIAQKISNAIRLDDAIVRFGGDEFVVFLKNTSLEGAIKIAERIKLTHQSTFSLNDGNEIQMPSVSLGVTRFTGIFSETLKMADDAIYKVKRQGKKDICYEE